MPLKVGVLTTHPIQYQVPWFRLLAQKPGIDLQVFFALIPNAAQQGDGFGVAFEWDIPLLDSYPYQVLTNVAQAPSVTSFNGCDTPEIFAIVRRQPWDAFIVNGWVAKSCVQLLAACRLNQVPCIVRGESNNLSWRPGWKRQLQRLLVAQYGACLYIGQANQRFYLDSGVPPEKLFFTPYCIENDRFAHQADHLRGQKSTLRKKFHLDLHTVTFLYCAKFVPKKRPLDLLQAIAGLKEHGKATGQVLMVGDGQLRPACEAFVQEHHLPVQFTGFLNQAEIVAAYVAADCLVLPSDAGETWGLVVNEAMACGLPAIVSDQVGCYADLISPGQTGWTYPLGQIDQLGDRLTTAIDLSSIGLATMGKSAQQKVMAEYNYQKVVAGISQALNFVSG
ncbi:MULTISPECIES: glycosyltransferase family 4 protein [unclassified Synechocystis]|uniref:glycosyltransferase family 4 protein n=1 Tax=unclassified Synechocystis TaxID=2640012 RepID=UPI00040B4DEC|nr:MULTISPECIES: glycosyltransferase family 4 protein [unclassified Synechocystis]AIE74695.1 glycosyl transferase group 1 [Synechocystis sp. PCC 6714]MCT0253950.1 glycosyltransferase family 4 protein [Synechocystis sp. CS-94]